MSTYLDITEIRHALIKQQFQVPGVGFDEAAFITELDFYLNAADNKLISHVNGRPSVDLENVPTYIEGMHQDLIDLLRYYVYYRFFDDKNIIVVGINSLGNDSPTKTNGLHFEKHFMSLMQGLSDYVLLNDSEELEEAQLSVGISQKRSTW